MMTSITPGHGVVLDGHAATPASARTRATEWLRGRAARTTPADDEWDIGDVEASARVARAWWAGPDIGFCGRDHPQARPVTVVTVPSRLEER